MIELCPFVAVPFQKGSDKFVIQTVPEKLNSVTNSIASSIRSANSSRDIKIGACRNLSNTLSISG